MLSPALALPLLLVPADPPADTWQAHEVECRRREDGASAAERGAGLVAAGDACRRAFETVPNGPDAIGRRSFFVFEAHRLYQLARDAGSEAGLCADARALDTFAAQLAKLKRGARPRDRQDVARLRAQVNAQLPGACPDGAAEEEAPERPIQAAQDPAVARDPAPTADTVSPPPVSERMDRAPTPAPTRRPLKIVGGAALGLGLGLGAGMISALVRGAALRERTDAVREAYQGQRIPQPELGEFERDRARGQRADHAAIGLGIAGALLTVVGVALVVVDARKGRAPRRFAVGPSIHPTVGLRLALEF